MPHPLPNTLILHFIYCVFVYMCGCIRMEVRGQLAKVGSLLPLYGLELHYLAKNEQSLLLHYLLVVCVCTYVCRHVLATALVWRLEDSFLELVLAVHQVSPEDGTCCQT